MAADSEKPAWPLMVLAVTSFVPCLGFALASATVSWALLVPRRHARVAMGIAIAGALFNVVLGYVPVADWLAKHPTPTGETVDHVVARTQKDLDLTAGAIEHYRADRGVYPLSLDEMVWTTGVVADSSQGPVDSTTGSSLVDPLSLITGPPRMFTYVVSADRQQYDLFSPGRDGKSPSSDDMRPMLSIEVRHKSGYQPGL